MHHSSAMVPPQNEGRQLGESMPHHLPLKHVKRARGKETLFFIHLSLSYQPFTLSLFFPFEFPSSYFRILPVRRIFFPTLLSSLIRCSSSSNSLLYPPLSSPHCPFLCLCSLYEQRATWSTGREDRWPTMYS